MKKRILVIEDDLPVREALREVLQRVDYTVVPASDGQEGITCLKQQGFDLLLLDLNLPKVSGFDVLDLVTAHYPSLPVIILSGQFDQCEPGALAGADVLVEKPPDVGLLLRSVAGLLKEPVESRKRRLSNGLVGVRVLSSLGSSSSLRLPKLASWSAGQSLPGNSNQPQV